MSLNSAFTGSAITVGGTEMSLAINSGSTTLQNINTPSVVSLKLDKSALQIGDIYELRIYCAAISGGTKGVLAYYTLYNGGTDDAIFSIPPDHLRNKWDITLKKQAGTDRAFDWEVSTVT